MAMWPIFALNIKHIALICFSAMVSSSNSSTLDSKDRIATATDV